MPLKKLNILVVGATGYVGLDLIYLLLPKKILQFSWILEVNENNC